MTVGDKKYQPDIDRGMHDLITYNDRQRLNKITLHKRNWMPTIQENHQKRHQSDFH